MGLAKFANLTTKLLATATCDRKMNEWFIKALSHTSTNLAKLIKIDLEDSEIMCPEVDH